MPLHDSLADVWNGNPVLREIREGLPHRLGGICGDCLMKGLCLGSCIAQNYYKDRDLWAAHWYCEEAHREGLFPESRRHARPAQRDRGGLRKRAGVRSCPESEILSASQGDSPR